MKSALFFMITAGTLCATLCSAQFTPVVAKQRTVQDVLGENGKILMHEEALETYLRNSKGATLTQTYSVLDGKPVLESGRLFDFDRHKEYVLDYRRHEAIPHLDLPHKLAPDVMRNANYPLGEETVNGIHCAIGPIYQLMEDGTKRQIGKVWNSRDYGISVKRDSILEPSGSPRIHEVVELYDVSFIEPDPNEFDLDKNFSVLEKKSAQACAKPSASSALSEPVR